VIQQSASDAASGTAADQSSSVSGGSLGAGSYAPEGHPDNTASVTAVVPPITLVPQTPVTQIVDAVVPFLPSPISNVAATLMTDSLPQNDLLYAGSFQPKGGGGGLINTATDTGPASATSSGGTTTQAGAFPTSPGAGSSVDVSGVGNMALPMIPGSAPGGTSAAAAIAPSNGVLGTPFTAKQLLIAAAVLFLLK